MKLAILALVLITSTSFADEPLRTVKFEVTAAQPKAGGQGRYAPRMLVPCQFAFNQYPLENIPEGKCMLDAGAKLNFISMESPELTEINKNNKSKDALPKKTGTDTVPIDQNPNGLKLEKLVINKLSVGTYGIPNFTAYRVNKMSEVANDNPEGLSGLVGLEFFRNLTGSKKIRINFADKVIEDIDPKQDLNGETQRLVGDGQAPLLMEMSFQGFEKDADKNDWLATFDTGSPIVKIHPELLAKLAEKNLCVPSKTAKSNNGVVYDCHGLQLGDPKKKEPYLSFTEEFLATTIDPAYAAKMPQNMPRFGKKIQIFLGLNVIKRLTWEFDLNANKWTAQ